MKKQMLCIGLGLLILVSGCGTPARDTLFQTSTIDALLAGVYNGDLSCGQLLKHGDFGIGTFDRVDGEMVVLEGTIYQIKGDGKVYKPDPNCTTPFATICHFNPEKTISINTNTDYKRLEMLIDTAVPNKNLFYAIRITGQFSSINTRSVPAQNKPYLPLKEVTSNQRYEQCFWHNSGVQVPPLCQRHQRSRISLSFYQWRANSRGSRSRF
jgi:acetolactate decarboxylase